MVKGKPGFSPGSNRTAGPERLVGGAMSLPFRGSGIGDFSHSVPGAILPEVGDRHPFEPHLPFEKGAIGQVADDRLRVPDAELGDQPRKCLKVIRIEYSGAEGDLPEADPVLHVGAWCHRSAGASIVRLISVPVSSGASRQ